MVLERNSLTDRFIILTSSVATIAHDTPLPTFVILASIIEMEQKGIITYDSNGKMIIKSKSTDDFEQLILKIIAHNGISSVRGLIDYYLRQFTYNELQKTPEVRYNNLANIYKDITFFKDSLIISDSLSRKTASNLIAELHEKSLNNDTIILFSLLYGSRLLKKFLDKQDYRHMLAYIKEVPVLDNLPISQYIISNIDLIRGHIIGLVAN